MVGFDQASFIAQPQSFTFPQWRKAGRTYDGEAVAMLAELPADGAFALTTSVTHSSWLAVRAWERRPDARLRLAHTAPVWLEVTDFPARPKKQETQWLIERMEQELARHRGRLPAEALTDYEKALAIYRDLDTRAR